MFVILAQPGTTIYGIPFHIVQTIACFTLEPSNPRTLGPFLFFYSITTLRMEMSSRGNAAMTFDRYAVENLIGQGGMGKVYKAHDTKLDRDVAIKILPEQFANDAKYIEQLYREARAAARLTHPNVVTIHDIGEQEGIPYIVMEYVEGQTLKETLRSRFDPLSSDDILHIVVQVCHALALAHQNRILHRDIKSDNIMVTTDGTVKVLDFGIARIGDLEESLSMTGEIKGTVEYMSPEQALGEELDGRSDIYSVGVVLYEMLTGELPFSGDSIYTIIARHINDPPVSPMDMNAKADPHLATLTMKALAKEPDDRYQSVDELLAALEQEGTPASQAEGIRAADVLAPFRAGSKDFYCDLVGRETELRTLEAAFDRARDGQGGVVFIAGEAGVGKTRLASELQVYALEQGAWGLTGASYYRDTHTPYFPFMEALKEFFRNAPRKEHDRIKRFIENDAPELRILVPFMGTRFGKMTQALDEADMSFLSGTDVARYRLFEVITRVLQEIARTKPLVLLLDDFHWADTASLQLLHHIAAEIRHHPILLLITYRQEELETDEDASVHPLVELIRRMSREDLGERMDLPRLGADEIARMLEFILKRTSLSNELQDMIFQETEGNPFFIQETLKWLRDEKMLVERRGVWLMARQVTRPDIPERVYDVLIRRLDRLSEDQRELLQVAAVEGVQFRPDTLARVMDLNKIKLLRTLHRLEKTYQVISSVAGRYRFDHSKIRDVLYDEIPPELRQEYHRMIAECLEEASQGGTDAVASELATHRYLAGDLAQAVPYLIRAGQDAERLFGLNEASRHYERALDAMDQIQMPQNRERVNLMLQTGRVKYRLGEWTIALKRFEAILSADDVLTADQAIRAEALLQIGRIKRRQGDWDSALEYYSRSLQYFQTVDNRYGTALVFQNYGDVRFEQGNWAEAVEYYQQGLDIARQIGSTSLLADIHTSLGVIASSEGEFDIAITHYTESIAHYESLGNPYGLAKVYNNLGMTYEEHQDWEQALMNYNRALELCRKMGSTGLLTLVYLNTAKMSVKLEQFEKVEDLCQRALDLLSALGDQLGIAEAYKIYGMMYTARASWEQAEFYLQQSKALFEIHDNPLGVGEVSRELGVMYTGRGEKGQARDALEQARTVFEQLHAHGDVEDVILKLAALAPAS